MNDEQDPVLYSPEQLYASAVSWLAVSVLVALAVCVAISSGVIDPLLRY